MFVLKWTTLLFFFICFHGTGVLSMTSTSVRSSHTAEKSDGSDDSNQTRGWNIGNNQHEIPTAMFSLRNNRSFNQFPWRRKALRQRAASRLKASFHNGPVRSLLQTTSIFTGKQGRETGPRDKTEIAHEFSKCRPVYFKLPRSNASADLFPSFWKLPLFTVRDSRQAHLRNPVQIENNILSESVQFLSQKNRKREKTAALSPVETELTSDFRMPNRRGTANLSTDPQMAVPETKSPLRGRTKYWFSNFSLGKSGSDLPVRKEASHSVLAETYNPMTVTGFSSKQDIVNKSSHTHRLRSIRKQSKFPWLLLQHSPEYSVDMTERGKPTQGVNNSGSRSSLITTIPRNVQQEPRYHHHHHHHHHHPDSISLDGFSQKTDTEVTTQVRTRLTGNDTQSGHTVVKRFFQSVWKQVYRKALAAALSSENKLKCLALFLAGHKYFGFDPRKGNEITWRYREKGFYASFPRPRLKKLHSGVVEHCSKGVVQCVQHLATKAMQSTVLNGTSCAPKIMRLPANATAYHPFKSAIDFFRFRTTASYYMCWHSLNQRDTLKRVRGGKRSAKCLQGLKDIHEPLNSQKRVLDFRTDHVPFQCAILSFCPDPCYGRKTKGMVPSEQFQKHHDPGNPCRGLKDQTCAWLFNGPNRSFPDLQKNRFNISCQCHKERKGFAWDSHYHLCVDVDECADTKRLSKCFQNKVCYNTVGSYKCLCPPGHLLDPKTQGCTEKVKVLRPVLNQTLLQARYVRKMQQSEGTGAFLKKQFEALLGLSSTSGAERRCGCWCHPVCVLSIFWWCLITGDP